MPLHVYRSHNHRDRNWSRLVLLLSPQQRKQLFLLIGFCLLYSYSFFNLQPDRSFDHIQKWNAELKLKEKIRLERRKAHKNQTYSRDRDEEVEENEKAFDQVESERRMKEGGLGGSLAWRREQAELGGTGKSNGKYLRGDADGENEGLKNDKRKKRHRRRSSAEALMDFIVMMSVFVVTRTFLRICLSYRQLHQAAGVTRSNSRDRSLASMMVPQSIHAQAMLLRNARFRTWVTQLNRERQQHGQPPLSLESLRLVLRNGDFSGNDYEALMRFHEEATIAQSMGATQTEIDRCPVRQLADPDDELLNAPDHRQPVEGRGQHCAICLEMYQMWDQVRTIPCFHAFHQKCIDPWLRHRAFCPVCKHPANGA